MRKCFGPEVRILIAIGTESSKIRKSESPKEVVLAFSRPVGAVYFQYKLIQIVGDNIQKG